MLPNTGPGSALVFVNHNAIPSPYRLLDSLEICAERRSSHSEHEAGRNKGFTLNSSSMTKLGVVNGSLDHSHPFFFIHDNQFLFFFKSQLLRCENEPFEKVRHELNGYVCWCSRFLFGT